jgi:hypothetical protein
VRLYISKIHGFKHIHIRNRLPQRCEVEEEKEDEEIKTFLVMEGDVIKFSNTISCRSFLKIISLNAQSLADFEHLISLRHVMNEEIIDILIVSETWLNDKCTDKYIEIPGYKVCRCDREGMRGGGVATYFKKDLRIMLFTQYIRYYSS